MGRSTPAARTGYLASRTDGLGRSGLKGGPPGVELREPAACTDLGERRAGRVEERCRLLGPALGDQPAAELLLRLGLEAAGTEGAQRFDAGAQLGFDELGIISAGGGHEAAEAVPLGRHRGRPLAGE